MNEQLPLPFPKTKLGLWDPRPRFLGMFQMYTLHPTELQAGGHVPVMGILDHLVHCECGTAGAPIHPKFHAAAAYVRFGLTIVSVSWPTWFPL